MFPLVRASAKAFGSEPDDGTAHKIGAFLVQATFQGNVITSAMFLTAMAANPLAAKLAGQMHINVSWGQWALAAMVPGIASLVLIPLRFFTSFELSNWWKFGALASVINILIWAVVGGLWWKLLGLW